MLQLLKCQEVLQILNQDLLKEGFFFLIKEVKCVGHGLSITISIISMRHVAQRTFKILVEKTDIDANKSPQSQKMTNPHKTHVSYFSDTDFKRPLGENFMISIMLRTTSHSQFPTIFIVISAVTKVDVSSTIASIIWYFQGCTFPPPKNRLLCSIYFIHSLSY